MKKRRSGSPKNNNKVSNGTSIGHMKSSSTLINRRSSSVNSAENNQQQKSNTMNNYTGAKPRKTSDTFNYALLLLLYTIQGIPLGLSASIPFLIQQRLLNTGSSKTSYNSQAIFSFATWPFSLKLLWAPIVDALYVKRIGRRKTWVCPIQFIAGCILLYGSDNIEYQLMGGNDKDFHVQGITMYFFTLYFLMATQDIAVDGWALTMLSKENRGKGPVCNSIGQNIGYFISFVGFLALNDVDSSENLWRPLLRMESMPGTPLVSLASFMKGMGVFIITVTIIVALFKAEVDHHDDTHSKKEDPSHSYSLVHDKNDNDDDEPAELDASEIGLLETYHRLWAVCCLPAVRSLFIILLTYRFPTALSDNVKFLKAVEYGLSKQTTALLSPAIMLPLAIAVPIVAAKLWHGHPLTQFLTAYKLRVTLVPLCDIMMLLSIKSVRGNKSIHHSSVEKIFFWFSIIMSTALQAIMNSLQFNAQMTFFASRVDPAIGGSYMTLLNTAANLGGTWPSSIVMYLVGTMTVPPTCTTTNEEVSCTGGKDGYFPLQLMLSSLGLIWIYFLGSKVLHIAKLPEASWRTKYFKSWILEHSTSFGESVRKFLKSVSFMERGESDDDTAIDTTQQHRYGDNGLKSENAKVI